jgi:hypothetical protein
MRLSHPLTIGLLCGLAILLFASWLSSDRAPESPMAAVPAALPSPSATSQREVRLLERQDTITRVNELQKMEEAKRQRDEAAARTREFRARVQLAKHSAWQEVIEAHRKEFETLRAESSQAPDRIVPCSICDAKGVLDLCVVCDHTGKCPTCHGSGKYVDAVCPTCHGNGKCFLCIGTGNMPCPFSQSLTLIKEVITPATPEPPADLPID